MGCVRRGDCLLRALHSGRAERGAEVFPEFAAGLQDLAGFERIWLIHLSPFARTHADERHEHRSKSVTALTPLSRWAMLSAVVFAIHVMTKVNRIAGVLLLFLFLGGGLVLPAVHRAHCCDAEGSHDSAQCPICQLASTPVMAGGSEIPPVDHVVVVGHVALCPSFVPSPVLRSPTQARAPPSR